jgi:XTP/dITP diphosphohydrolase/ATP diphosphatase
LNADVEGSSAAVLRNWDEIKASERLHRAASLAGSQLDTVARALPALAEAAKLGSKAAKSGFDWPDWRGLLPKLAEETAELEAEVVAAEKSGPNSEQHQKVEAELGDLLFTVVNLGRHLGVDAEMALRGCNLRFRQRFQAMERASDRPLEELAPAELEALWTEAKRKLAAAAGQSEKGSDFQR